MQTLKRLVGAAVVAAVVLVPLVVPGSAGATPAQESAINATAKRLGATIGKPKTDFSTTHRHGKEITFRRYTRGLLVHNGSKVVMVSGHILSAYNARKGPRGKLGAPLLPQKCGLLEGACIQRFQNGAAYWNPKAPGKNKRVVYGAGKVTTYIAAARSQAGYREPGYRKNKYGKWLNGGKALRRPWCSFFQSWVSKASGHGKAAAPKKKTFAKFAKAVRRRGHLSHKPAVGKFAFIDFFYDGRTSHVGLVIKVEGHTITTVEGNIHVPSGSSSGVHVYKRSTSQVNYYAPVLR